MTLDRIQRWEIILSDYHYILSYCSGHQINNADCVSRATTTTSVLMPLSHLAGVGKNKINFNLEREAMENHVFLTELEHAPLTPKEVAYFINCDPLLSKFYNCVNLG